MWGDAGKTGVAETRSFECAPLLNVARRRLASQRQFLRPMKGPAATELASGLARAEACIAALARPQAALLLPDPDNPLAAALPLRPREAPLLGIFTLGYDQQQAFAWLGRDYVDHHLQTLLARETLFALGRGVAEWAAERQAGLSLRRIALTTAVDGAVWDVGQVRGLLALFGPTPLGVTLTEGGCFSPLHALLTVYALRPAP